MDLPVNEIICGDWVEVARTLPTGSVHCIVTSPPYWGQRDYGVEGQLGLEKTFAEHIEKLVAGFREVRRVLRDDGTLWLNYGDKYNGFGANVTRGGELSGRNQHSRPYIEPGSGLGVKNLKPGNLIGLAWRLAFALQADGWILRSDTIWAKGLSFCSEYSGSTMPESLNGWRWERCKIKINSRQKLPRDEQFNTKPCGIDNRWLAEWADCPGCKKCEGNPAECHSCAGTGVDIFSKKADREMTDKEHKEYCKNNPCLKCGGTGVYGGYVLRRGSWRPTKAHEYLFEFVKTSNYFGDIEAVREEHSQPDRYKRQLLNYDNPRKNVYGEGRNSINPQTLEKHRQKVLSGELSGRNLRDVWVINPQAYPQAHYATFPEALVEPCIKVSTSQKGVCPKCGSQWARVVDSEQVKRKRPSDRTDRHNQGGGVNSCGNTVAGVSTTTLGWRATCGCGIDETEPAMIYDPFAGSGTVAAVAARLGRNYIGSELNEEYINSQANLRIAEAETGLSIAEQKKGQGSLFGNDN